MPPLEGKIIRGNALVISRLAQEHDNLPREESIKNFLLERQILLLERHTLCL